MFTSFQIHILYHRNQVHCFRLKQLGELLITCTFSIFHMNTYRSNWALGLKFPEIIQRTESLRSISKHTNFWGKKRVQVEYTKEKVPRGSAWKSMFTVPAMAYATTKGGEAR